MHKFALLAAAIGMAFATSPALSADAPRLTAEKLYQQNCAICHGAKMEGAVGPSLVDKEWLHGAPTKANLVKLIAKGVPEKNMPAWSPALTNAQIALLADYVAAGPKQAAAKPAAAKAAAAAATTPAAD